MAHIEDRWYHEEDGPDDKKRRKKTPRHGTGMRYRVRYIDPSGRERSKSFPDRAKGDAEAFLITVENAKRQGTYIDPDNGRLPFRTYFESWRDGLSVDETTFDRLDREFRLHILPTFGDLTMASAAQPATVRSWSRHLRQKIVRGSRPLADSYRRNLFTNLSMLFNAAVDDRVIPRNPCATKTVKAPRYVPAKVVPWSLATLKQFRANFRERYQISVDIGSGLGLRQGEIFGLSPDDIDPTRPVVRVVRQVKIVRGVLVFAPPKGGKEREIPLPHSVQQRLASHAAHYEPRNVTLPWKTPTGPHRTVRLYLYTPEDKALYRDTFNANVWKTAIRKTGIDDNRQNGMHVLRHTYASVLLDGGESIKALAGYLGHADPGFTLRIYTHLLPSSEERTRRVIDQALDGSPPTTDDVPRPTDGPTQ